MRRFHFLVALVAWFAFCSFRVSTDEDLLALGYSEDQVEELKTDSVVGKTGALSFGVCNGLLNVPSDFVFLAKDDARHLLIDYWGNDESRCENLIGVLVPKECKYFAQIEIAYVFTYDNCGYVSDDDASKVDYDEMAEALREECQKENASLPEDQHVSFLGWAVQPRYVKDDHVLVWAKTWLFGNHETVNYDMRVLGKDGLVSINAVGAPVDCDEFVDKEAQVLKCFSFQSGYTYADFNPSRDRTSEWTIGGLVAGTVLAKSGFFAKVGIFLLKFWKIIAVAVVGLFASIGKFFKKNDYNEEER